MLKIPKIIDDESLASYIYRLATENYSNSTTFLKKIGVTKAKGDANNISFECCSKLSNLTRYSTDDLYRNSINYFQVNDKFLEQLLFLRTRVKCCPECLNERIYHKWVWTINPICICLKHKTILIDKCQKCHSRISFDSLMKGQCIRCSSMYSKFVSNSFASDDLYLYHSQVDLYNRLLGNDTSFLPHLNFYEYIYLAKKCLLLFEDQKSFISQGDITVNSFMRKGDYFDNNKMLIALANVYWLFQDLKCRFPDVLEGFYDLHYKIRKRRKLEFEELFNDDKYLFVKKEYQLFHMQLVNKGMTSMNIAAYDKKAALIKKKKFYTKRDIFQAFDITKGQVDMLCAKQLLTPKIIKSGEKVQYLFDKSEVNKIISDLIDQKKDLITKLKAAEMQGIYYGKIQSLIEAGLLHVKTSPLLSGEFVSEKEVVSLIRYTHIQQVGLIEKSTISFTRLIEKYATSGMSIARILSSMKDGNLNPVSEVSNPKLTDLFFYTDEINDLLIAIKREYQNQKGYGFIEVAEMLNIGDRTLHKLMDNRLIIPDKATVSSNGKKHYFFSKETITSFRSNFITTIEANRKYNIPLKKLRKSVADKKLKNYLKGICKNKLLLKTDELEKHYKVV